MLSIVIATLNEEKNIGDCIKSAKSISDEILVFDEGSIDRTREIARKLGAKVTQVPHKEIFHITKQKALEAAKGDWILQLDADERVSDELAGEIKQVINMSSGEILGRHLPEDGRTKLLQRHLKMIKKRDGIKDASGDVVAFMIPRLNYFLGKPLIHAGAYPDGVIRLVKKGKAHFPAKSVHEQIKIDGKLVLLTSDLIHYDTPTFRRYISRMNRYTDLKAQEMNTNSVQINIFSFVNYVIIKTKLTFLNLYVRHLGFLDGARGFLWSVFSALHYPIAYFKYTTNKK